MTACCLHRATFTNIITTNKTQNTTTRTPLHRYSACVSLSGTRDALVKGGSFLCDEAVVQSETLSSFRTVGSWRPITATAVRYQWQCADGTAPHTQSQAGCVSNEASLLCRPSQCVWLLLLTIAGKIINHLLFTIKARLIICGVMDFSPPLLLRTSLRSAMHRR